MLVDEKSCQEIMKKMRGSTAHGLSMIYRKLMSVYGEDFWVKFSPREGSGVRAAIMIPAAKMR